MTPESLPDDPQTIRVAVDVSGLPAVMALARAARDVVDDGRPTIDGDEYTVPVEVLDALRYAVDPIYPGAAT